MTARFIDIHILHPVPYSNLNRDDLGTPKQTVYGASARARISSQCLKRAARLWMESNTELAAAYRTRRLPELTRQRLLAAGWSTEDTWAATWVLFRTVGITVSDVDGEAQGDQLTFTGGDAADALAAIAISERDAVLSNARDAKFTAPAEGERGSFPKKDAKPAPPKEVEKATKSVFASVNPVIALAGRMLADLPGTNVDGALQVAHAFTTHPAAVEPDYFTAVDDFNTAEETGAGHINAAEFTSGVFYRYATIDLNSLAATLGDDVDPAPIVTAFLRAFVIAEPTGKQHATAAHTLPAVVSATVRSDRPVSLAAAFETPIAAEPGGGYTGPSARRLDEYAASVNRIYGTAGVHGSWYVSLAGDLTDQLGSAMATLDELVNAVAAAVARQ
jgi:CRISPR system Cascade subunit CasC